MHGDAVRTLRVFIAGESATFEVDTSINASINQLKKLIQKERELSVLRDVDPNVLVLWKLNQPLLIKPEGTLGQRIQAQGPHMSKFAVSLDSSDTISEIFPETISLKYVHLVVWHSATGGFEGHVTQPKKNEVISNLPFPFPLPSSEVRRLGTLDSSSQIAPALSNTSQGQSQAVKSGEDNARSIAREPPMAGTKRQAEASSTGLRPVEGKCDRCASSQVLRGCKIEADWPTCQQCRDDKQACYWEGVTRTGIRPRVEPAGKDDSTTTGGRGPVEFVGAPLPHMKKKVVSAMRLNHYSQDKLIAPTRSGTSQAPKPLGAGPGDSVEGGSEAAQSPESEQEDYETEEEEVEVVESSLRAVKGRCDRCRSFAKPARCEIEQHDLKCKKCYKDMQGCYWDGISRSGRRKKKLSERIKYRKTGRGKDRKDDLTFSQDAVDEERARLRARIKVLEHLYNELG